MTLNVPNSDADATETDLDRVVKVNINGVFNCAKEAIRVMTSDGKGGVILNTGSCASVHPIKDRVVYAATKGAVLTMTTSDHLSAHLMFLVEVYHLHRHLPWYERMFYRPSFAIPA